MPSNNYVPRVTQLDALQLDNELIELFKQHINEAFKYFPPGLLTPVLPEMELALKTLMFKYSVMENNSTFGHQMLSIAYDESLLSRKKIMWLYGYTVGLKYLKDRALMSFTSWRRVQYFFDAVEKFQLIGDIVNFLRFIQTGKNPGLIDFILNLELQAIKPFNDIVNDYSYTREMIWHSFIELIGSALPLVNIPTFKRRLRNIINYFWLKKKKVIENDMIAPVVCKFSTVCIECRRRPILPHTIGCEHVFCYYCIQANKIGAVSYECPSCFTSGSEIIRVPTG